MKNEITKIGVAVIVKRGDKILIGKRLSAHGDGKWGLPGGHLEFFETINDCAIRETKEETGLDITNLVKGDYTEDFFEEDGKHYLTIFIVADALPGEPQVLEPEKCATWEWLSWDELPKPLFMPFENLIKSGFSPFTLK